MLASPPNVTAGRECNLKIFFPRYGPGAPNRLAVVVSE
jgi:hypothetical protein